MLPINSTSAAVFRSDIWEVDDTPEVLIYGHSSDLYGVAWDPAHPTVFATASEVRWCTLNPDTTRVEIESPGTKRLKLLHDDALFSFQFRCAAVHRGGERVRVVRGRGLHSSTFQLNLSRF